MKTVLPISIWPLGMINCFLIKGKDQHILVDTGNPRNEKRILRQIKKSGIDTNKIGLIIVTHGHIDHFGSAARLQRMLDVPILAHESDLPSYRSGQADKSTLNINRNTFGWRCFRSMVSDLRTYSFTPDHIMKGDETVDLQPWGIEGKVIHTPGHTPGSVSVVLENGEVIVTDMVASGIGLGGVMFNSRVKHPAFHDDLIQLESSFEKIFAEPGDIYYLGHGGPLDRSQMKSYYNKYLKGRK